MSAASPHPDRGVLVVASALDPGDPERLAIERHAAECPECARAWREAGRLSTLLDGLAAPPPPDARALARTQARVRAELAAAPRTSPKADRMPAIAVAAGIAISSCVALALSGSPISTARGALALATIAVAALLPSLAMRSDPRGGHRGGVGATLLALGLSLAVGLVDYHEVALVSGHAMGCLQAELAIGALPLVAMLALARSRPHVGAAQTAAVGAAGALAGQAVLLTSCAADESVLHVLFFHVAGVVLAGLYGAGLGRLVRALA